MNTPTIKSIELINFMCHKHLLIEFEKMITCIGGRNGSGKSAVMIALGILFGRRAQSLERGNSYKSLIKSGCNSSVIRATLSNHKKYKTEFFQSIIIERRLKNDTMQLLIMNENRKIYSTKKQDLENLLEIFELKFDNPLNYLTQELSKKFLNISKSEDLYEFFVKGTELQNISFLHELALKDLEKMKNRLLEIENEISEIDHVLEDKNKKLELVLNMENSKKNIELLEIEKEYSKLKKKLEKIESIQREINKYDSNISENLKKIDMTHKKIDDLENKAKKLKVEQERKRIQDEKKIEMLKNTIHGLEIQKIEMCNELKILNDEISSKKTEIENSKKYTNDYKKNIENEILNLKNEIQHKLKNLEELNEKQKKLIPEVEKEKIKLENIENKKIQLKNHINFYTRIKNNQNNYFGPNFDQFLNEIKRTRFDEEIIGPIGLEIKLKEQKWYKAASIILRNVLSHFIVFNKQDRIKLTNIFNKYRINFSILLPNSKNRNIIKYNSNKNYKTLLDILDIKNPVIINQLIILNSIEQIILIEDRSMAYKIIREKPNNVDSCYTLDGDRIKLVENSLTEFRARIDKFYFESVDIENLNQELKRIMSIKPELKNQLDEIENEIEILNSKIEIKKSRIRELSEELKNIPEIKIDENVEQEINILESQKKEIEDRVLEIKNGITKNEKEINKLNQREIKMQDDSLEILKLRGNEQFLRGNNKVLESKKNELSKILAEMSIKYDNEKLELKNKYNEIPNPRNLEIIEDEIRNLRIQLEISKEFEKKEDIQKNLKSLQKSKTIKKNLINRFKSKVNKITTGITKRIQKRDFLNKKIAKESTEIFKNLVSQRGYVGEMNFDHKNKKLEIKMKLSKNIGGSKNTLSGGERSFAGICFLISLWSFINCPIKILDEFDVFMDTVNRSYAINFIFEFFSKSNKQIILITPLSMKEIFSKYCDIIILEHTDE